MRDQNYDCNQNECNSKMTLTNDHGFQTSRTLHLFPISSPLCLHHVIDDQKTVITISGSFNFT